MVLEFRILSERLEEVSVLGNMTRFESPEIGLFDLKKKGESGG
jgi:hypothetical protein